ncbi:glycine-rich domain-containing protein [Deinococcus sp.]|uniref:glycine-rich domain-containing protein n=1 Tax=Deinococcus sp. TaxID=47478 RepID=UPI003B58DEC2
MTTFSLQPDLTEQAVASIPSAETLERKLLGYAFPDQFAERLAHEHGWTLAHSLKVLHEYRRFLVLASAAGESVTPSKAVDAAWHEHLTHTRDYWLRLTLLLPSPLHHDPSGGAAGDAEKYAGQYLRTLELYRARFGEPDAGIWPDPDATSPNPTNRFPRWLMLAALWLIGGAALWQFGWWAVAGLVVLGLFLLLKQPHSNKRRSGGNGSGSDDNGFFGDFGGGGGCDTASGDSGCSDGGSSCGSGCGS